jgi:hypothetical protein
MYFDWLDYILFLCTSGATRIAYLPFTGCLHCFEVIYNRKPVKNFEFLFIPSEKS